MAEFVARGEAGLGFQGVAEILAVSGAAFAGRIPDALELLTPFSAAVASNSQEPEAAAALVASLSDPFLAPTLQREGLEPPAR